MLDQFLKLNDKIDTGIKDFKQYVQNLNEQFEQKQFECENGNSFLSLKNKLMIQYLNNLAFYAMLKLNGEQIEGQKCILRLAELRCIFEKLRPIEAKLKYQIDKLLKLAENKVLDENDPLNFKPNTADFEDNENDDEDEDDEGNEMDKDGIYRPPKVAPVYCDIDETPQEKMEKRIEEKKRKALESSLIKDLQKQYSDAPEEIYDDFANTIETKDKEAQHREEYEEENFTRKQMSKKELQRLKRLKLGTDLNRLTSFDDARILLDENVNMEDYVTKKSKKGKVAKSNKGKKGKKGKKKRIRYT